MEITAFSGLGGAFRVNIRENPKLTSVTGFKNVKSMYNLTIGENPNLTEVSGLTSLETVEQSMGVFDTRLTNLNSFSNLESVGQGLFVYENPELTNLCGLQRIFNIDGVTGGFVIEENAFNPSEEDIKAGNCED